MPRLNDVLCWTPLAELIRSHRRKRQSFDTEKGIISDLLNGILLAHKDILES